MKLRFQLKKGLKSTWEDLICERLWKDRNSESAGSKLSFSKFAS
jgi:hypothetical protein